MREGLELIDRIAGSCERSTILLFLQMLQESRAELTKVCRQRGLTHRTADLRPAQIMVAGHFSTRILQKEHFKFSLATNTGSLRKVVGGVLGSTRTPCRIPSS